eukprot:TRINITY_DN11064_c0_g1_i1.p1 TRINITY_DN11064_c0_g1~~TRINITY_DN11064_c0_g1_i1.p1  ORF type:complete len:226 (+),score=8.40 TRINITY_DN11064_c0_g1_i1:113-790(+)
MVGLGGRRGGTVPPDHFFGSSTTWSQNERVYHSHRRRTMSPQATKTEFSPSLRMVEPISPHIPSSGGRRHYVPAIPVEKTPKREGPVTDTFRTTSNERYVPKYRKSVAQQSPPAFDFSKELGRRKPGVHDNLSSSVPLGQLGPENPTHSPRLNRSVPWADLNGSPRRDTIPLPAISARNRNNAPRFSSDPWGADDHLLPGHSLSRSEDTRLNSSHIPLSRMPSSA